MVRCVFAILLGMAALAGMQETHSADESLSPERQTSPSPQVKAPLRGQIAGHVLRADTGEPLADVLITLSPVRGAETEVVSQRSAVDGGYVFTGVTPGTYRVLAYRSGFVGRFYGQKGEAALMCPPACISISPGQKLEATNIRLAPYVPITAMKDDALSAAYSGQRIHMSFGPASLSSDGKHFAFAVGGMTTGYPVDVWIYDLDTFDLRLMSGPKEQPKLHLNIRDLDWGENATLYVSAQTIIGPEIPVFLAATTSGTTVISEIPKEVGQEPKRQFDVTSERLCRGCANTLSARRRDGSGSYKIAEITRNFILDAGRSVVLYPASGIVIFDLNTRKSREIALPVAPEDLLDEVQDGSGFLVAYFTVGSCTPDSSPRGESEWTSTLLRGYTYIPPQDVPPRQLCFVRLP